MINKIPIIIIIITIVITVISPNAYSAAALKHNTLEGDQVVNVGSSPISFVGVNDHVYRINGNLTINANIPGNSPNDRTGVIFVEQGLNINQNYTYGSPTAGTVFVVKGDVKIDQAVTRIDAVIISEGEICTATELGICPSTNITTSQLVINGSLISLTSDPAKKIKFRRNLSPNNQPAEKINQQVKYLVILKDLFSDTQQKWEEVTGLTP